MAKHQSYISIAAAAEAELIEKKSRFIGHIAPAATEAEAQAFLDQVRAKYRDANHNVYALQIGSMNEVQRANDDGEPAGTAGRPVLEALKKADLHNIILVVTRYFGGTLLGSGGLVRAYGKAAQLAIEAAQLVEVKPAQMCSITFNYSLLGKMESAVAEQQLQVIDKSYGEDICFLMALPVDQLASLRQAWLDLSAGTIQLQELGERIEIKLPLG